MAFKTNTLILSLVYCHLSFSQSKIKNVLWQPFLTRRNCNLLTRCLDRSMIYKSDTTPEEDKVLEPTNLVRRILLPI